MRWRKIKRVDAFNVKNNVISACSLGLFCSPFTDHLAFRKPCLAFLKANICPYFHCLWCNEADKIKLSHSLIRRHSLLACCNSSPLFCSRPCLSSCLPLFNDCFAGHDDISLKTGRKREGIRPVQSLASVASVATTVSFMILPSLSIPPHLFLYTPSYNWFLLAQSISLSRTHTHAHTATLSHLCNHNSATKKSGTAPSLRNQQLWDNSVTNKVKGRALWWLKLKRYFIFFCVWDLRCVILWSELAPLLLGSGWKLAPLWLMLWRIGGILWLSFPSAPFFLLFPFEEWL